MSEHQLYTLHYQQATHLVTDSHEGWQAFIRHNMADAYLDAFISRQEGIKPKELRS